MPLDSSIYRTNPLRSVADYEKELTDAELAKQMVGQNKLALAQGQLKMDEYQRGVQRQNALQSLAGQFTPDAEQNAQILLKGGFIKEAQEYKDKEYEAQKRRADAMKAMAETLDKKIAQHTWLLTQVQNPQMAVQWMQAAYQDPDLGKIMQRLGPLEKAAKSIPQDPQDFQDWLLQAAEGAGKMRTELAMEARDAETKANNLRVDTRVKEEGAANRGVQIRGQNITARGQDLADARSRESTAAAMTKPFEVTGPDGTPMLVQQDKQGNIRPVEGFGPKSGSAKPLTDAQAKALLFGTRAQESDKILNEIGDKYSPAGISTKQAVGKVPLLGGGLEALGNVALSDNSQRAEQAQRDFVNAVLRRESGAVIADSEFANAQKQYFPQPGDSEAVKQQKAKNRQLALNGILAEVPKGQRDSITPKAEGDDPVARALKKYGQ